MLLRYAKKLTDQHFTGNTTYTSFRKNEMHVQKLFCLQDLMQISRIQSFLLISTEMGLMVVD